MTARIDVSIRDEKSKTSSRDDPSYVVHSKISPVGASPEFEPANAVQYCCILYIRLIFHVMAIFMHIIIYICTFLNILMKF
jgi:hypothetical protein